MKRLKPFIGRCLQVPRHYIMGFKQFIEVEDVLSDLKSGVTDLDDLFDEKSNKQIDKNTD